MGQEQEEVGPYKCPECPDRSFKTERGFRQHVQKSYWHNGSLYGVKLEASKSLEDFLKEVEEQKKREQKIYDKHLTPWTPEDSKRLNKLLKSPENAELWKGLRSMPGFRSMFSAGKALKEVEAYDLERRQEAKARIMKWVIGIAVGIVVLVWFNHSCGPRLEWWEGTVMQVVPGPALVPQDVETGGTKGFVADGFQAVFFRQDNGKKISFVAPEFWELTPGLRYGICMEKRGWGGNWEISSPAVLPVGLTEQGSR